MPEDEAKKRGRPRKTIYQTRESAEGAMERYRAILASPDTSVKDFKVASREFNWAQQAVAVFDKPTRNTNFFQPHIKLLNKLVLVAKDSLDDAMNAASEITTKILGAAATGKRITIDETTELAKGALLEEQVKLLDEAMEDSTEKKA